MKLSASIAAVLAYATVACYIYHKVRESISRAVKARRLGCKPAVRNSCRDPSGIYNLLLFQRAHGKNRFLDFVQEQVYSLQESLGRPLKTLAVRTMFFQDLIFTFDPLIIQTVLALKFQDFELGVGRTENFKPVLGNGIFAANGRQWEDGRNLIRPRLLRIRTDLGREDRHVQALMAALEGRRGEDGWTERLDLQELLFRYALDSATDFVFGQSVDAQLAQGAGTGFLEAMDRTLSGMTEGARLGKHYWLAHTREFKRAVEVVDATAYRHIHAAIQQRMGEEQGLEGGLERGWEKREAFIDALIEDCQDPYELRGQLLSILMAGRDTTASTLAWFFHIMADVRHRAVFRRLRAVIVDEFGGGSSPREMSVGRLRNCQYLQWCVNECLRLYPAVPLNTRVARVDTHLPTGGGRDGTSPIFMKKGDEIVYSTHHLHRCKEIWGPDADVFRPERWQNKPAKWEYLPFHGGPRSCVGQQHALVRITHLIVRLVQRVEAIEGPGVEQAEHVLTLVNCPANGVCVRLRFAE
ncbi:hypothetical protein CDD83_305 [Cordyceps sp. RAO-2017]|nr:hypothetical protein CDD83_305 [Cordyceps sp. RAO-2017]